MNGAARAIAVLALSAGLAVGPHARAAEPAAIFGRWATDPADCADNRYVWIFAEDRAGLVVSNAPLGGWRRPVYAPDPEGIVVAFVGPPRREILWRVVKEGELVAASHREDGRPFEDRSFQPWRRCPN